MIKIKVSDVLGKRKMTQRELSDRAGIRPATVSMYYRETIKEIGKEHLDSLCKVFNCQPGDLLEYIPITDSVINNTDSVITASVISNTPKVITDSVIKDTPSEITNNVIIDTPEVITLNVINEAAQEAILSSKNIKKNDTSDVTKRRELIRQKLLAAPPGASDRSIAKELAVSNPTVSAIHNGLIASGELPPRIASSQAKTI